MVCSLGVRRWQDRRRIFHFFHEGLLVGFELGDFYFQVTHLALGLRELGHLLVLCRSCSMPLANPIVFGARGSCAPICSVVHLWPE